MTTISAGKRCENAPTSRAVPQAEGWPVKENGLLPGSGDFSGQQVDVVDEDCWHQTPRAVLVEAHGPEADITLVLGSA